MRGCALGEREPRSALDPAPPHASPPRPRQMASQRWSLTTLCRSLSAPRMCVRLAALCYVGAASGAAAVLPRPGSNLALTTPQACQHRAVPEPRPSAGAGPPSAGATQPLLYSPLCGARPVARGAPPEQLTRITVLEEGGAAPDWGHPALATYHVVAFRPESEASLAAAIASGKVDLISLDPASSVSITLKPALVREPSMRVSLAPQLRPPRLPCQYVRSHSAGKALGGPRRVCGGASRPCDSGPWCPARPRPRPHHGPPRHPRQAHHPLWVRRSPARRALDFVRQAVHAKRIPPPTSTTLVSCSPSFHLSLSLCFPLVPRSGHTNPLYVRAPLDLLAVSNASVPVRFTRDSLTVHPSAVLERARRRHFHHDGARLTIVPAAAPGAGDTAFALNAERAARAKRDRASASKDLRAAGAAFGGASVRTLAARKRAEDAQSPELSGGHMHSVPRRNLGEVRQAGEVRKVLLADTNDALGAPMVSPALLRGVREIPAPRSGIVGTAADAATREAVQASTPSSGASIRAAIRAARHAGDPAVGIPPPRRRVREDLHDDETKPAASTGGALSMVL